jgi:hypothetical protein
MLHALCYKLHTIKENNTKNCVHFFCVIGVMSDDNIFGPYAVHGYEAMDDLEKVGVTKDMTPGALELLSSVLRNTDPRDWEPWVKEKLMDPLSPNQPYWMSLFETSSDDDDDDDA